MFIFGLFGGKNKKKAAKAKDDKKNAKMTDDDGQSKYFKDEPAVAAKPAFDVKTESAATPSPKTDLAPKPSASRQSSEPVIIPGDKVRIYGKNPVIADKSASEKSKTVDTKLASKAPAKAEPKPAAEKSVAKASAKAEPKPAAEKSVAKVPAKAEPRSAAEKSVAKVPAKAEPKSAAEKSVAKASAKAEPKPAAEKSVAKASVKAEPKQAKTGRFEIKKTKDDRFVFNLYAPNSVIVATSQVYSSSQGAVNGIESIIANAAKSPIEDQTLKNFAVRSYPKWELYIDNGGQYRFRLNASNGNCIVHSQGYTTKASCKNGIESIIRCSVNPEVDKSYLKKNK